MKKIISALIILSFILASCQEKAETIGLNLEQGKVYTHKTDNKSVITQFINGQPMDMTMIIRGDMSFRVTSVGETAYEMDVQYDNFYMSMQMPQGKAEFSSTKDDPNDIFSQILKNMIGNTFQVTLSKSGKVVEVNNLEALFDSAFNTFEGASEEQKQQAKEQLMQSFGEKAFKGAIEMITAIYPKTPVKKGDKWIINTKLESGMAALLTSEYELADQTSEHLTIKGDATFETEDKDAYIQSNGMPLKYDLKGKRKSEIKVDRNTGWIVEAKIYDDVKGTAFIKENPQMPNGLEIPMMMNNTNTITN